MKVSFASSHTVSLRHNGVYFQVLKTKKYLEELGVEVKLFSPWDDHKAHDDSDIFHLFTSNFASYDMARYLNEFERKFVVSSIFYSRHSAKKINMVTKAEKFAQKIMKGISTDFGVVEDTCNWANHILPNTNDEGQLIVDSFGVSPSKITMVPNGVEDRFLQATPDLFYNKYGMKDFILNVGHIGVERKNTLSLIRSLKNIDHPAVIIGKVSNNEEARLCFEEAKLNKNLILIDGLDHDSEMLASAYAASSVFALPALFETPGIAALEAAITGSEVVITPHGGTKDYFDNMAEYVDPYNIESITKGIEAALNKKSDGVLKKHVEDNFLWQRVAEKTLKVYEQVLSK